MADTLLSTHIFPPAARSAQRHYEQLQQEATHEGDAGEYARRACAELGIGLTHRIEVKPAKYERGKLKVVAQ